MGAGKVACPVPDIERGTKTRRPILFWRGIAKNKLSQTRGHGRPSLEDPLADRAGRGISGHRDPKTNRASTARFQTRSAAKQSRNRFLGSAKSSEAPAANLSQGAAKFRRLPGVPKTFFRVTSLNGRAPLLLRWEAWLGEFDD
jgi:hypothetical protein